MTIIVVMMTSIIVTMTIYDNYYCDHDNPILVMMKVNDKIFATVTMR